VSVTVTQGVSVVGVAGWPVTLTGWPVTVGVVIQPGADAERYRCACLHCIQGPAGRGDWCGLDWRRSSIYSALKNCRTVGLVYRTELKTEKK